VLEGVLELGGQAGLVQELGGLKMGETQVKLRLGGNGLQDRERNALADRRFSVSVQR
jgi:hypothetical protein